MLFCVVSQNEFGVKMSRWYDNMHAGEYARAHYYVHVRWGAELAAATVHYKRTEGVLRS